MISNKQRVSSTMFTNCSLCNEGLPPPNGTKAHMTSFTDLRQSAQAGCPLCVVLLRCIMRKTQARKPVEALNLRLLRNFGPPGLLGIQYDITVPTSQTDSETLTPSPELQILPLTGLREAFMRSICDEHD